MESQLYRNWWLLAIKGVFAIIFGVYALLESHLMVKMVRYFGFILLAGGLVVLIGSLTHKKSSTRWLWWLILGFVDIIISLPLIIKPLRNRGTILIFLAAWVLIIGVIQLITSFRLRGYLNYWWAMLLTGVSSIIIAAMVFLYSYNMNMIFSTEKTVLGAFVATFGALLVYLSFLIRKASA